MTVPVHLVSEAAADWAALLAPIAGSGLQTFATVEGFLDAAPLLAPGPVVIGPEGDEVRRLELLAALRPRRARFIAIAIIDPGDVAFTVQAMRAGAMDVLERTVTPDRIAQVLHAARSRLAAGMTGARGPSDARARIASLTPRERQVLNALAEGARNKAIARPLDLSPRTVEIHRAKLMERLNARSLSDALRLAFAAEAGGEG